MDINMGLSKDQREEMAKAVARLDGLRRAQERNARKPLNDSYFERFFGYRPDRAV